MLVVADSSPINILVRIDCIDVLPKLFGRVLIPLEVREELSETRTPESVRAFIGAAPGWLEIHPATRIHFIPTLDKGEEAAISLALEVKADALLIDEKDGRRAALAHGLTIVGTLGVLEQAAKVDLISLPEVLERLRQSDFRIDPRMVQDALERDARNRSL